MLLEGKKILITGVLNRQSIAFRCAQLAQREGAEILLTSFGRVRSLTEKSARRLDTVPDILELDINNHDHVVALTEELRHRWGRVDGALHAIAFAPSDAMGGNFMETSWESAQVAWQTSTFSLKELAVSVAPLMEPGGSIVTLDFDNRFAWPVYDWMGVSKAGLESVVRYLARYLGPQGIRVNAVCAGPLATVAAKNIPGFKKFEESWTKQAPLGWDTQDTDAAARMVCVMLSDWTPKTTGEMVHVDGGYHAMGAPLITEDDA
ncbi:MAG: meromycolic acid enoyl-[acyl-carrier-protein] reductase [Chloroflexota bacterium]|nr:meromycolic acid enoyl-[acyl-carrier-protein] reductase [Chloroflexota bacterium]